MVRKDPSTSLDHGLQKQNFNGEFYTFTRIDTINNSVEISSNDTKLNDTITRKFEQT